MSQREIVIRISVPEAVVDDAAPTITHYLEVSHPLFQCVVDLGGEVTVTINGEPIESSTAPEAAAMKDSRGADWLTSSAGKREYVPLPDGRIPFRVLLVVGEEAHATTPWHTAQDPMVLSVPEIARDCDMPPGEVVGREYTALGDQHGLHDFRLVNDPRL